MAVLIVVESPRHWPLDVPGTELVLAREYLTNPRFVDLRRVKVFNLCRTYGYQSVGYYVSLLAAARGHRPLPSVTTLQDLRQSSIVRIVNEDLEASVQRALASIKAERFTLSIYFGRNLAKRYDRLTLNLFNQFQSPLLRAQFGRAENGWQLRRISTISANEVPQPHWPFVVETAAEHFAGRRSGVKKRVRLVPTCCSTCPFSHPAPGVHATGSTR